MFGSRNHAKKAKKEGENLIAVFNADMVGYTHPDDEEILALNDPATTQWLHKCVVDILDRFLPEYPHGASTGCCTDHQSFYEQGFPAISWFENTRRGMAYPQYHTANDDFPRVSLSLVELALKGVVVSALTFATPDVDRITEEAI